MKIYDLSLTIKANMVTWPDDVKPKITTKTYKARDNVTTSTIFLSSHNGTHVDAPKHFYKSGKTIDEIDPKKLVGKCKVIDLTRFFKAGGPAEIGWAHFGTYKIRKGDKLLIKTGSYKFLSEKKFNKSYISISNDAAKHMIKKQIDLIGIDYLGIEKKSNPGHPVHRTLLQGDIVILEGLDLKNIVEGEYTLVCAPLKLDGADGSPARVFLIQD